MSDRQTDRQTHTHNTNAQTHTNNYIHVVHTWTLTRAHLSVRQCVCACYIFCKGNSMGCHSIWTRVM